MRRRLFTSLLLLGYLLTSSGLLQAMAVAALADGYGHRAFAESSLRGTVYYLHHEGHSDRHERQPEAGDQCWLSSRAHGHDDHIIEVADDAEASRAVAMVTGADRAAAVLPAGASWPSPALGARVEPPPPLPVPLVRSCRSVLIRCTVLLI